MKASAEETSRMFSIQPTILTLLPASSSLSWPQLCVLDCIISAYPLLFLYERRPGALGQGRLYLFRRLVRRAAYLLAAPHVLEGDEPACRLVLADDDREGHPQLRSVGELLLELLALGVELGAYARLAQLCRRHGGKAQLLRHGQDDGVRRGAGELRIEQPLLREDV